MPREVFGPGFRFLDRAEILSFEEIVHVAEVFRRLGVEKFRLTGGEPLVRRHLARLVAMLAALPGTPDLAITTNGFLLGEQARALREAGLRRVSVSLDSLDDEVFRRVNDVGVPVSRIVGGIEAAVAAGFAPVKVNMVVQRGVNEESILPMARWCRERRHILRFIEYMDVRSTNGWRLADVVPAAEILAVVDAEMPLEAVPPQYPGEVADRWRYRDGGGEVGIIASVTQPFCRDCTRARLSADGRLYTCLFATDGHDLRALLRGGASDGDLEAAVRSVWRARTDRYSEERSSNAEAGAGSAVGSGPGGAQPRRVEMSRIGG
jgi:cyclic pyranopterin phosphate synthase